MDRSRERSSGIVQGPSRSALRAVGESVKVEWWRLRMSTRTLYAAAASTGKGGMGGEEGGRGRDGACPEFIAITGKGESGMDHCALCPNPSRPRPRRPCPHLPHPHRPKVRISRFTRLPTVVLIIIPDVGLRTAPHPRSNRRCACTAHLHPPYITLTATSSPFFTSFLFNELARQHGGRGSCARTYPTFALPRYFH